MKYVALDAMGVIYAVNDDVKDLLYPFIVEKGGVNNYGRIKDMYIEASLGKMSASDFWRSVGIAPVLEDEYLDRHRLSRGLIEFLHDVKSRDIELWCLSNDVSQWSKKLRRIHRLGKYFRGVVISGDAGVRKPDRRIYELLLTKAKRKADEIVFVDDNIRNLDAAAELGLVTVLFDPLHQGAAARHQVVSSFSDLMSVI
ncbi:MAG: HAD-IA family hydrolase [Chloroflexi bacterium]|nr:HAD-IA family hydrolase [Chloroflexota bacterium]